MNRSPLGDGEGDGHDRGTIPSDTAGAELPAGSRGCERYDELATSMTPHLLAGWKGEKPPRQAVDDAATAATEFWKGMGGNASKAEG